MAQIVKSALMMELENKSKELFGDHRILPVLRRRIESRRPNRFEHQLSEINSDVYTFLESHNFAEIRCRKLRVERYEGISSLEAMIVLADEIHEAIYNRHAFIARIIAEEDRRVSAANRSDVDGNDSGEGGGHLSYTP
ncbi:hypothetical protein [Aurantimonas manganoxydans]|uniref:hypothetical protein n=1 Tax=Aurantimonas manganoxydans TaxID=651183 RepID=UPI000761F819|nr:hypothetical protein [Aurantimonas manganoxydans]